MLIIYPVSLDDITYENWATIKRIRRKYNMSYCISDYLNEK
ncbi:hypothetical protein [Spiroplasma endosymbiont of Polydrusus cervinus]